MLLNSRGSIHQGDGKLPPSEIFVKGELKNRSGVKEEGFKGKHEVTSWRFEAESWTVESNCLLAIEAKYTAIESKRKSLSLEVSN